MHPKIAGLLKKCLIASRHNFLPSQVELECNRDIDALLIIDSALNEKERREAQRMK